MDPWYVEGNEKEPLAVLGARPHEGDVQDGRTGAPATDAVKLPAIRRPRSGERFNRSGRPDAAQPCFVLHGVTGLGEYRDRISMPLGKTGQ
jgi:hypothetical protein